MSKVEEEKIVPNNGIAEGLISKNVLPKRKSCVFPMTEKDLLKDIDHFTAHADELALESRDSDA